MGRKKKGQQQSDGAGDAPKSGDGKQPGPSQSESQPEQPSKQQQKKQQAKKDPGGDGPQQQGQKQQQPGPSRNVPGPGGDADSVRGQGKQESRGHKQQGKPQQQQQQQPHGQQPGRGGPQQGRPQQQQQQQQQQPHGQQPGRGGPQQGRPQQQQQQQPQRQQDWGGQHPSRGGPQQGRPQQQQQQQPQRQQDWGGQQPSRGGPQQGRPQQQQQQQQQPQGQQAWGAQQPSRGGPQQGRPQQQQKQQPQGQQAWGAQQPSRGGPQQGRPQQQQQQRSDSTSSDVSRQSQQSRASQGAISKQPKDTGLSKQFSALSVSPPSVAAARGTKGRRIVVESNYLQLFINKIIDYAYQYDIKFEPDKPKRFLRLAFNEFRIKKLPKTFLAFDGRAIVFSPQKLPSNIDGVGHEVTVVDPDSGRSKTFIVTLKEAQDSLIELRSLKNYQSGTLLDKPMRAIQCLDVVLRSPCYGKASQAGRSFYSAPRQKIDLRDGYELWYGLFQATVLGEIPLLNIDVCHKAFPSEQNVIEVIKQMRSVDVSQELQYRSYGDLKSYLRGLDVIYNPPNGEGNRRSFRFNDLKDSAEKQTFEIEGQRTTVARYFAEKKNYRLRYPKMPVLHVGPRDKNIYLPAELCAIPPGQNTTKKTGTNQVREIIRHAAVSTQVRKQKTMENYERFNHNSDPTVRTFGVEIDNKFIDVDARVINAPQLEYDNHKLIRPMKGSWRPDNCAYINSSSLDKWAILVTDRKPRPDDVKRLASMIKQSGRPLNMQVSEPKIEFECDNRYLDKKFETFAREKYQIVFVIISSFDTLAYATIKQKAEIGYGVLTQCIKTDTLERRMNPSTVSNILLKVNAKLNGTNLKICEQDKTPIMANNNVMFLGADVTHPSPDQRQIPSVVGVAASHDINGFQYNMRWRLQDPKKEIIEKMDEVLKEQLEFHKSKTGKYPGHIMYYRDGVSEGQFEQVRRIELMAMEKALNHIKPRPLITCIVVQKRNHTRFFPKPGTNVADQRDKFQNVPPGTIVDTKITHPNECQFFMVSHESIQGVAKPTKYCIIRDDANLNIDDLQAITYNLCHLFARCNRTVSYPAPAYNAHLAAYRGRVYIELLSRGQQFNMNNLDKEYRNRQVKPSVYEDNPMYFV